MSIELLFVEPQSWKHAGLPVVKVDGATYAVAEDDDAADFAAVDAVRDSFWAFRAEFIGSFLGISDVAIKAISKMQGELCEDAQEIIELLLGDRRYEFVDAAIAADGRGHFLAPYDGEERDGEDVSPPLEGKLLYRLD